MHILGIYETHSRTALGSSLLHEKIAVNPTPTKVISAYQAKTTVMAVDFFTLLTQAKPMPISTIIQMVNMSKAEASAYKAG